MADDLGPHLREEIAHGLGIGDIGLEEAGLRGDIGQVASPFAPEIVDDKDLMTSRQIGVDEVGADEARASCDKDLHTEPDVGRLSVLAQAAGNTNHPGEGADQVPFLLP